MANKVLEKKEEKKPVKTPEQFQAEIDAANAKAEENAKKAADAQAALDKKNAEPAPRAERTEPTEEEWVKLEAEFGMDRDSIKKQHALTERIIAPLRNENAALRAKLAVGETVESAIKEAAAKDPQFSKIQKHVEEYLADLPMDVKADPKRLAREMDKAIKYGRGSVPVAKARVEKEEVNVQRERDERTEDEVANADEKFGKFDGDRTLPKFHLEVKKLVKDSYRDKHTHPGIEGAVMVDERADWDEQIAQRPTSSQNDGDSN